MDASPWWVLVTSTVPSAIVGVWTAYQWLVSRKDKKEESHNSYEEKRDASIDRERKMLAETNYSLLKEIRSDLTNCRIQLVEKDTDRHRAWDRARYWHQKAWDMRNEAAYARQIVESANRLSGNPPHNWNSSLDLPNFDDHVRAPAPRESV